LYTKTSESSEDVYEGVTGNFAFGTSGNYKFVNGLLVQVG